MNYKSIIVGFVVLLFLSCATTIMMSKLSQEERELIQIRNFNVPDSILYPTVLKVLIDIGYPIQMHDKTIGIIQTEPLMMKTSNSQDAATALLVGAVIRQRNKVVANVKDGIVKLNFTFDIGARRSGFRGNEPAWEPTELDTSISNRLYYDSFRLISEELNN